jgi:hypothetical protein
VVAGLHRVGNKEFDNNMRVCEFICKECGKQFSATLDQIRCADVTEEWIGRQHPN